MAEADYNSGSGYRGRQVGVGIALERDGATQSNAEYFYPWMSNSFKDVSEQIQNESVFGNIAHYNDQITTSVHGEGDLEAKLWHKGLYYLLALAFGQLPSHEEGEDGSHKYTFTMANNNNHLASTMFVSDPKQHKKFPSAMLNEMSLEWTPEDFAKVTMSMISKRSIKTNGVVPAYINDKEFKPDQLLFKIADSVRALDDAEAAKYFRSASFTITKNVEGVQASGSGQDYATLMNGDLEASFSFEKLRFNTAFEEMSFGDVQKAVQFGFVDTANSAGTNTPTSLKFTLPKVAFTNYEPSYDAASNVTESFEGTALLDLASGNLVTAELVTKFEYPSDES